MLTDKKAALKSNQQEAIEHVLSGLAYDSAESDKSAYHLAGVPKPVQTDFKRIVRAIEGKLLTDVQFHPDRIAANGLTVVNNLMQSGLYKNQFETGISNGGMNSAMNDKRRLWESRLFGQAYDNGPDSDRPKYGAINLFNCFDGACPRFGSCFLRLEPSVSNRCTLTIGDSNLEPDTQGTPYATGKIVAAIAKDFSSENDHVLRKISFKQLTKRIRESENDNTASTPGRILDCYLEVQIHGSLDLHTDVEYISADSSFITTDTGDKLRDLAKAYNIDLRWHPGFVLPIDSLPKHFRGEEVFSFAKSIHEKGKLNSVSLGTVAESIVRNPTAWTHWGDQPHALQLVKKTWHAMVAYGTTS